MFLSAARVCGSNCCGSMMLEDLEAGEGPPGVYTRWIDAASSRQLPSKLGKKPFAGDERSPSGEEVPPARAWKNCVDQEVWTSGIVMAKGFLGRVMSYSCRNGNKDATASPCCCTTHAAPITVPGSSSMPLLLVEFPEGRPGPSCCSTETRLPPDKLKRCKKAEPDPS